MIRDRYDKQYCGLQNSNIPDGQSGNGHYSSCSQKREGRWRVAAPQRPYTSHGYFKLTQNYGITPSMSRRGNPYDNAMAENFFFILKTECIYCQKIKTFQQANHLIDEYILFYNYERTGLAPLSLRQASL